MNANWGGMYDSLNDARAEAQRLATKYGVPINILSGTGETAACFFADVRSHYTFATPEAMSRCQGAIVETIQPTK